MKPNRIFHDGSSSERPALSSGAIAIAFAVLITPFDARADIPCSKETLEDKNLTACPESAAPETTRGLAQGTGNRASAMATSALAYNKAGLPLGRLYHIEANVDYQPAYDVVNLGAAVADSVTSKLAAGLSFRGSIPNSEEGYTGFDVNLGLGFPLMDELSIGLGGRYVNLWGQDEDGNDDTLVKGLTMDAGLRIMPIESLHFALLAYNVVDRNSAYAPVTFGGSVALSLGTVAVIGLDTIVDVSTFEETQYLLGGGGEYLAGDAVPLRVGYLFDTGRETHAVTGGVGYTSRKMAANLSLRQQIIGGKDTRLMADFQFFVY
jgi:hypothetical protein